MVAGRRQLFPDSAEIKQLILMEFHDSPYAGHMCVTKSRSNIQKYFTWRNLYAEVLLMSSTVLAAKWRSLLAIDLLDCCNLLKFHRTLQY